MVKSFKYRLRPTKKQEQILLAHIDECRILYNQLLCARIQAWKNENKSLSQYDQTKTIPLLKQQHAAFKQVYSQVLQQVSQRVDLAFKGFFRRLKKKAETGEKAGFPRYKSQGIDMILSRILSLPMDVGWTTRACDWAVLVAFALSSIGHLRVSLSLAQSHAWRRVNGSCLSLAILAQKIRNQTTGSAVGIDVGLNSFAVTSDGQKIENQRFFRKEEKSLAKAQRKWDAVKKRPKTDAVRERRRKVIGRVHERIRNKRHNFAHQESRKMVNRHGFIAVEKLDVKEMQKEQAIG